MQENKKTSRHIQIFCTVALFLIFTICTLMIITLSASTYKGMSGTADKSFNADASVRYVTNKLNSADFTSDVILGRIDETQYISFGAGDNFAQYNVIVFYKDGQIFELTQNKADSIKLDNAVPVLKSDGITFLYINDSTVCIKALTADNKEISSYVCLRCATVKEAS